MGYRMSEPEIIMAADPGRTGAIVIVNSGREVLRIIDWPKV